MKILRGNKSEWLLRDRGKLRQWAAKSEYLRLKRDLEAFKAGNLLLPGTRPYSSYKISLTSWTARLDTLPLTLLSLVGQTLRPAEIAVWLTRGDMDRFNRHLMELFSSNGVRFAACDDLRSHKKWLPMLEEGQEEPFVVCDDDIMYPDVWFENLVREDSHEAYVGAKCHRITVDKTKGSVKPYADWVKQIQFDGVPEHAVLTTGCGGEILHPDRVSDRFRNRKAIFANCPKSDDIWLKAAHLDADIPCLKTKYSFPCLEIPGTDDSGLAITNNAGGKDQQLQQVKEYFLKRLL